MADNLPLGPTAPARKGRGIWSDLSASAQTPEAVHQLAEPEPAVSVESSAQEPDTPRVPAEQGAATPVKSPTRGPAKKRAGGRAKSGDRAGQISVVLGSDRHARLKNGWKRNATAYDAIADLVREAIDEKLDQLEQ